MEVVLEARVAIGGDDLGIIHSRAVAAEIFPPGGHAVAFGFRLRVGLRSLPGVGQSIAHSAMPLVRVG